ncbi:hypothetical protein B0H66DRAFT_530525 [Apodospora peruviana]|uniref:Uncharacterized protein n=1 Tax=Apodospora peruviana TaxID=516989 RepID=A0AAE0MCC9_9PEZI|nr:hypothetical protein B0H66DRAFT_530525 [Apodospora peruviana]
MPSLTGHRHQEARLVAAAEVVGVGPQSHCQSSGGSCRLFSPSTEELVLVGYANVSDWLGGVGTRDLTDLTASNHAESRSFWHSLAPSIGEPIQLYLELATCLPQLGRASRAAKCQDQTAAERAEQTDFTIQRQNSRHLDPRSSSRQVAENSRDCSPLSLFGEARAPTEIAVHSASIDQPCKNPRGRLGSESVGLVLRAGRALVLIPVPCRSTTPEERLDSEESAIMSAKRLPAHATLPGCDNQTTSPLGTGPFALAPQSRKIY